jgi:hypothetical protein
MDPRHRGAEPEFDIDYEYGRQGEMFVTSIRKAMQEDRVEVKRDGKFAETGNLYVEFACLKRGKWSPSGIATSTSEAWTFVLGDSEVALTLSTELLKDVCRMAYRQGRIAEEKDGSHPTKGVLLKVSTLMAYLRRHKMNGG